jgi:hypothetical protein
MTRRDAQRFAQGLHRAFLDIPETEHPIETFTGWTERWSGVPVSIMERFATAKGILRDLIAHCRDCSELWIC